MGKNACNPLCETQNVTVGQAHVATSALEDRLGRGGEDRSVLQISVRLRSG